MDAEPPRGAAAEPVRILVLGAGSIGVYVAAALWLGGCPVKVSVRQTDRGRALVDAATAAGCVTIIRRGAAAEAKVPAVGFFVADESREERAFARLCDCVVVATKRTANGAVAAKLRRWRDDGVLRPDATVLILQNGLGAADALQQSMLSSSSTKKAPPAAAGSAAATAAVTQAVVRVGVSVEGATFTRTAGDGLILDPGVDRRVLGVLTAASLEPFLAAQCAETQHALQAELNLKFVWNCALNALSALSDRPSPKALLRCPETRRVALRAASEVIAVYREAHMPLAPFPALLVAVFLSLLIRLDALVVAALRLIFRGPSPPPPPDGARSSMWDDFNLRRPTEKDFLNGRVADAGATLRVPTPVNRALHRLTARYERLATGPPAIPPAALARALDTEAAACFQEDSPPAAKLD